MKNCDWCGKYYEVGVSGYLSNVSDEEISYKYYDFCSNKCAHEMSNLKGLRVGKWRFCAYCNTQYDLQNADFFYQGNFFCSQSCLNQVYINKNKSVVIPAIDPQIKKEQSKKWEKENPELAKIEWAKAQERREKELNKNRKQEKRINFVKKSWALWLSPYVLLSFLIHQNFPEVKIYLVEIYEGIAYYVKNPENNNWPFVFYTIILPLLFVSAIGVYFVNTRVFALENVRQKLELKEFLLFSSLFLLIPIFFQLTNFLYELITVGIIGLFGFLLFWSVITVKYISFYDFYSDISDTELKSIEFASSSLVAYALLRTVLFISYIFMILFYDCIPPVWIRGAIDLSLVVVLSIFPLYVFLKMSMSNRFVYLFSIGLLLNVLFLIFF